MFIFNNCPRQRRFLYNNLTNLHFISYPEADIGLNRNLIPTVKKSKSHHRKSIYLRRLRETNIKEITKTTIIENMSECNGGNKDTDNVNQQWLNVSRSITAAS